MSKMPATFARMQPGSAGFFKAALTPALKFSNMNEHPDDTAFTTARFPDAPNFNETFTNHGIVTGLSTSRDRAEKEEALSRMVARVEELEQAHVNTSAECQRYCAQRDFLRDTNAILKREVGMLRAAVLRNEAIRIRHLEQVEQRMTFIAQETAVAEQSVRDLREYNHMLAVDNAELSRERNELVAALNA